MNLLLKKIYCHGEDNSMVYMSILARYGWKGDMFSDIIKLNYNGIKREAFLTVKVLNHGVGMVIERIINILENLQSYKERMEDPVMFIIEQLEGKLEMEIDPGLIDNFLKEYGILGNNNQ